MFTGIISEVGKIRRCKEAGVLEIEIEAPLLARDVRVGDSISVNGVCLTATSSSRRRFVTQAMSETVRLTTLGELQKGTQVNLELAVKVSDRLGGHIVQGHVDGVAEVIRVEEDDGARRVWFAAPNDLLRYMVPKGSVTLDGVSLTLMDVGRTAFGVALIPHTLLATGLGSLKTGSRVNVEVDVLAKYVERLVSAHQRERG